MLKTKSKLVGKIKQKSTIKGKLNNAVIYVKPALENLEVTPSQEQQVFTHENSSGYDEVIVNAIPESYIEPDGTLDITENSTYDVKQYAEVNVNIEGSGGGGSSELPTTVKELNDSTIEFLNVSLANIDNLPNSNPPYTTEPVTLYSPNGELYYVIRQRSEGTYNILWFTEPSYLIQDSSAFTTNHIVAQQKTMKPFTENNSTFFSTKTSNVQYNLSANYATLEECLNAIQSPNTTYTAGSNYRFGCTPYEEYLVPYSNLPCMFSIEKGAKNRKISSNETIV